MLQVLKFAHGVSAVVCECVRLNRSTFYTRVLYVSVRMNMFVRVYVCVCVSVCVCL